MVTGSQYVACMQLAASRKRTAHTGGHGNTPPCGSTSFLRLWLELPPVLTSYTLLPNQLCLWVQPPPPPTMLFLGAGVQLPACSWESSPGPRRRSCPLHCGMWLWNPHSWWHSLDWASTGDTWPTNKQSILFTVQCMLDNHKYMHVIYWTIAISYAPCFWHFGDPFSPEQHSCSYNRFSCGLTVCILLYVW